jgi:C1A family cysteine protease
MTSVRVENLRHHLSSGHSGGWLPDRPSHKDWRLSKRLDTAAVPPESPRLDQATYPPIRDQGQQGSCVGHGARSAMMQRLLFRDFNFWIKYDLSPAAAYYNARVIERSVREDSGAYIRDVVEGAAKWGVARESDCPYNDRRLVTSLSERAQTSAKWHQALHYYRCDEQGASPQVTVDNILRALRAGLPVIFGFTVFSNIGDADGDGYIRLPGPRDSEDGGHCMCIFGADTERRVFTGANSWSNTWGYRGYFTLPFDYFLQGLADDAWAVDHE